MKFIEHLKIRDKLLLISFIPLAALIYFLADFIITQRSLQNKVSKVYEEVLLAEKISDVVHQLQQERGLSISYTTSSGKEGQNELQLQREATDKSISALNNTSKAGATENLAANKSLNNFPLLRDQVNQLQLSADSVRFNFTSVISPLLNEINKTSFSSVDPEVKNLLHNHMYLLNAKQYFGQLRSLARQALLTQGLNTARFAEFSSIKGKYESNLDDFRKNLSDDQAAFFRKKMTEPSVNRLNQIVDSIYSNPRLTGFSYSQDEFIINGNAYLNVLKELEDHYVSIIRTTASNQLTTINRKVVASLVIACAVMFIILFLLYVTITSIVSSVTKMKTAADRVTRGEVDLHLDIQSKDEIGNLANSFNQLVEVSREYAQAAEMIGRGDYTAEVKVRSENDQLGKSLNNMKANLQQLSTENATRTWLLTGHRLLNDKMRGEKDIKELAQNIITQVTTYLEAQVGTIYLFENGYLNLIGSYAFQHRKNNSNRFAPGEGLAGQAALEKVPIIFNDIPEDYIKIQSGLGSASPKNLMVYPFLYENNLRGVIEIGFAKEITDLQKQFLEMGMESIGIAIHTAEARTQLKELLEETQRQAEELESQQEELRQINEELQEKTQMLERSEAELKAQQEELQQTNEELEEKASLLEEQKEKLELAKIEVENKARELEVTSKYKSEFLANMSHELRTPLNSILILSQLLVENKYETLSPKDVEFAVNINNSGTDLLNLINEILDLSKVEAGKIELEINEVSVGNIVDNLQSMFREVAKSKKIDFETYYPKEKFKTPLLSDKQRLEQILRNLLSNAFKFTDKGGTIELKAGTTAPGNFITNPKLRTLKELVFFTVKDNGIGIPHDKQGIIFNAFQQADGTTKRKYGGTGLGLSISRELAFALGGEIQLKSEQGKGSEFTLYLPARFDESIIKAGEKQLDVRLPQNEKTIEGETDFSASFPQQAAVDDRYTIESTDKTILIIEDDVELCKLLLSFSREKGYKVILAHQGNTGLSLARHHRPDAIILDLKLPVMDGSDVLKQLKSDPLLRHIPVQIISGYDKRKESLEQGAFSFLRKPLDKEKALSLFDRIEEFMNKKMKKLLVVEDNKEQNIAIRELIGNNDVKSFAAYTGSEAYRMLEQENYDCIIVDLGLPDMSGFELLEKIKENQSLNKVPIIVYTGRDLNKEEVQKLNKLASTVVLKTTNSKERLLDETTLFLHRVESKLPKEKQQILRKLHRTDEVLKNKKVLIVDDDVRNTYSLTNVLEEEEMQYVTAENGKVALQTLADHEDIDLILMDVMMPEMDGFEATRTIRKSSKFGKLPIIGLTAKAMKGDREKCLESGMSDYISKPVNIEQLLSLMRVWLYK
jgi:CheY-like chemotaxis protein/signal transduction histidine kinase/HAMP domain-containing protein